MYGARRSHGRIYALVFALAVAAPIVLAFLSARPPEAAAMEQPAGQTPARSLERNGVEDPATRIPGSRVIDLTGMDPGLHREFMTVVATVAAEYALEVPYILPTQRWNGVTGAPSSEAYMFASDLGIGFDPGAWSEEHSSHILGSLALSSHSAANGKTFSGLIVHEMGHVLLGQRFGITLLDSDNPARALVEDYRGRQGATAVTGELGEYAWRGSVARPNAAWQETFAEAFSAYVLDPYSISAATSTMVGRVLGL